MLRASAPAASAVPAPALPVEAHAVEKPVAPAKRGLGMPARLALGALGAFGALLALQRNDLLGASARTLFGAPSPATPHGVQAYLASLPKLASPESLKPKPLPPRAVERAESASPPAAPARTAAATKAPAAAKAKKPAKGKAKPKPSKGK